MFTRRDEGVEEAGQGKERLDIGRISLTRGVVRGDLLVDISAPNYSPKSLEIRRVLQHTTKSTKGVLTETCTWSTGENSGGMTS
jgi:hypothetical protein